MAACLLGAVWPGQALAAPDSPIPATAPAEPAPPPTTTPAPPVAVTPETAPHLPPEAAYAAPPAPGLDPALGPLPEEPPAVTQKWWFWAGIGAVVIGTAVLLIVATRPSPIPDTKLGNMEAFK